MAPQSTTRKHGPFWQPFRRQRNSSEISDEFLTEYRRNIHFPVRWYFVGNFCWNFDKTNVVGKFRRHSDHKPRKEYICYTTFLNVLNFLFSSVYTDHNPRKIYIRYAAFLMFCIFFIFVWISSVYTDEIPTEIFYPTEIRRILWPLNVSDGFPTVRCSSIDYVGNFPL